MKALLLALFFLAGLPLAAPAHAEATRAERLDRLFERLKTAPDDASAERVSQAISGIFLETPSPTAELLMQRAGAAMAAGELADALNILDTLIDQQPEYVEAINRRATAYFLAGEYDKAAEDIETVLKAEPRHFGALAGLGLVRRAQGREIEALKAFRAALAVYPRLKGAAAAADELARKLERNI